MATILSEVEAEVLALIGQQTMQWYNSGSSETVIKSATAKGYIEEDVNVAINLLVSKQYVRSSFRTMLQLTADGYYAYAFANFPGFADLVQRVEVEICKNNHTNNRDVAKLLQADQLAVDYIFNMMFENGTLNNGNNGSPLAAGGPLWYIMEVSPEFQLKCREASGEDVQKFLPRTEAKEQPAMMGQDPPAPSPQEKVTRPTVFVGSSVQGLAVANEIHAHLDYDAEVTVWNQGAFELSKTSIEALVDITKKMDFGVFVLIPEDVAMIRGTEHLAARDNVIFELGLFIGALGRDRCFMILPRNTQNFHLPTDLLGITPADYEPNRSDGNLNAAVSPACTKIRSAIKKKRRLDRSES